MKTVKDKTGFSLIEMMMVVAIMAVLAAVAVPNYLTYQNRCRQSEAQVLLSGLYTSEVTYFAEHTVYAGTFQDINFRPAAEPKYYKNWCLDISNDYSHFFASCSADLDSDGKNDIWVITDCHRDPWNIYDDLTDKHHPYPYSCY